MQAKGVNCFYLSTSGQSRAYQWDKLKRFTPFFYALNWKQLLHKLEPPSAKNSKPRQKNRRFNKTVSGLTIETPRLFVG